MTQNIVAFANNDVATIAWSYGTRPDGCMGFAVYRIDNLGVETALPSHAVFKGYQIKSGQTTEQFPIQKFYWKDPYARLVAEKTGNRKFRYKVVPLEGQPGHLKPMKDFPAIVSNEVSLSSEIGFGVSAFFNRGLISTQRVSRAFKGKPGKTALLDLVSDPASSLRASLSGDMVEALTMFVDRAKESGRIYAALYELGDEELIKRLEGLGKRLKIVLSNSAVKDSLTKKTIDGNQGARDRLAASLAVKSDRMMPAGHIGHNKFLVYVDQSDKPRAVLLGSTNWTCTGLCTQTNNTLVVEDEKFARRYLNYWKRLASDTKTANGIPKSLQGSSLRTWDAHARKFKLAGGGSIQSWFSPNTPGARSGKPKDEICPVDMQAVVQRIERAKHAILFLAFYPGTPSIANWAAIAQRRNKELFVRGCVTNKSAAEGFYYELKGATPPPKVDGQKTPVRQDPRVFAAEAFDGTNIPTGWQKEILSAGFAIIHDKILVIDPFWEDCVVVTGSHNLGHKASYDNDENLVIIEGNRPLALAYTTHVLDVYDHFAARRRFGGTDKQDSAPFVSDPFLKEQPVDWLAKYFDASGEIRVAQLKFWLQARVNEIPR